MRNMPALCSTRIMYRPSMPRHFFFGYKIDFFLRLEFIFILEFAFLKCACDKNALMEIEEKQ